jgi:hypothetical protein
MKMFKLYSQIGVCIFYEKMLWIFWFSATEKVVCLFVQYEVVIVNIFCFSSYLRCAKITLYQL